MAWWTIALNVVCGAWGGFLIAALWYGHQELARLRVEVAALRARSEPAPERLWSGPEPPGP